mmetsp:Transcript_130633/g.279319  ORF Transcript_130633/g.279319 Transcript_130633/m.279319 type:complete len:214 (+) Transcript_130633:96-737(+)
MLMINAEQMDAPTNTLNSCPTLHCVRKAPRRRLSISVMPPACDSGTGNATSQMRCTAEFTAPKQHPPLTSISRIIIEIRAGCLMPLLNATSCNPTSAAASIQNKIMISIFLPEAPLRPITSPTMTPLIINAKFAQALVRESTPCNAKTSADMAGTVNAIPWQIPQPTSSIRKLLLKSISFKDFPIPTVIRPAAVFKATSSVTSEGRWSREGVR